MKTFTDARGSIYDFENGTHVITCKAGSKRANHYHKTSGHRSILTRGSLDYYEKSTVGDDPIVKHTIVAPAIFDTGPMIDHLMHFRENSEFVCHRINGSETTEDYEKDVVRLNYDMEEIYNAEKLAERVERYKNRHRINTNE